MAINKEPRTDDQHLERLIRKRDQAGDMAGLARQDGDMVDCEKKTNEAKEYSRQISEYLVGGG